MANSLITGGAELRTARAPEEEKPMAEVPKDTRVVMYREGEAREFPSPEAIPKDEGWVDHPDKAVAKPKPLEKARAAKAAKRAAEAGEPEEGDDVE